MNQLNCYKLIFLNLNTAFNTIHHKILIHHLHQRSGINATALNLVPSHLNNRSFSVNIGTSSSTLAGLSIGVPQGSIIGPILFSIHIPHLVKILIQNTFPSTVVLLTPNSIFPSNPTTNIHNCINEITTWMAANSLQLNDYELEILFFIPPDNINQRAMYMDPQQIDLNGSF